MGQEEGGGIHDRPQLKTRRDAGRAALVHALVMVTVAASFIYFLLGALLALALHLAGIAFDTFATFGGVFSTLLGLVMWWLLVFAGVSIYATSLFPWGEKVLGWPKKN